MSSDRQQSRNRLLAVLGDRIAQFEPLMETVVLDQRTILYDINAPITEVYFPVDAVASILGVMSDGTAVETATVGNEGLVGLPVFLGTDRTTTQAFVQIPGKITRCSVDAFRSIVTQVPEFREVLGRYTQAFFTLVAQSSACNRVHDMSQRCARWLLHSHDRVGADEFPLTHQFLSQMIGVRRATVTEAMQNVQARGAVSYAMGRIHIVDRAALEAAACECYAIIAAEFFRLLGPNGSGDSIVRSPLDTLRASDGGLSVLGDIDPPQPTIDDE